MNKKISCVLILGLNNTGKKITQKIKKEKVKVVIIRKNKF